MSNINRHEFTVPADVQGFWVWDRMHSPRPQTPLTHDIFWTGVSAGSNSAAQEFLGPFHNESKAINYYAFTGGSLIAHGEDEKERRMSKYRRSVEEVLPRLEEKWRDEWLPLIQSGLVYARAVDYATLSDRDLLERLDRVRQDHAFRWKIHAYVNFVLISASRFADFYNEVFEPTDPTEPYLLLQGFPNRSVEAGSALWGISRKVRADKALLR